MRAFLGIEIPEEIRENYTGLCKPLKKGSILSFVKQEKMHITLAFFPDLPEKKIQDVVNICSDINIQPFTINCDNIGLFKRKGIPSTIFVKIVSEELQLYTSKIHEKLSTLNIPFDNRKPFTPHITIARVKEMLDENLFTQDYKFIIKKFQKSSFLAENINLYSSDMINYKIVSSYNFSNNNDIVI